MRALAITVVLSSALVSSVLPQQSPPGEKDSILIVPQTSRTSTPGAASNFTGHAQVEQLFGARGSSRVTGGIVVFDPGARSAWHTHPVGQILFVTAGTGLVQQWGSPVHVMKTGDVVWIPAGVKHWHGASASSGVTHIAIQEAADGRVVDWLEPVTDAQYASGTQAH